MHIDLSPAVYVTFGFDAEEAELATLFWQYLSGFSLDPLGFGLMNFERGGEGDLMSFFAPRAETVTEVWEDFVTRMSRSLGESGSAEEACDDAEP